MWRTALAAATARLLTPHRRLVTACARSTLTIAQPGANSIPHLHTEIHPRPSAPKSRVCPAADAAATPASPSSSSSQFDFDATVNSAESFSSFQHAFRAHHSCFISHPHIPPSQRTVVVAVSGGVDSAMTAQLLCSAGIYQRVVAVHMRNWDEIEESGHCSGERDAKDAIAVCAALGIPLETVDYSREYFNDVFQDLLSAYSRGETPSPDVLCNRLIKFQLLMQHVRLKYGEHAVLATGHYARIKQHPDCVASADTTLAPSSTADDTPFSPQLFVGVNPRKDQSYFLSSVPASALRSCLFPLGNFDKQFLKQLAASWAQQRPAAVPPSTPSAASAEPAESIASARSPLSALSRKRESMGICFIGKRPMHSFLGEYITLNPGAYIDVDTGALVGRHLAWEAMTLGQKAHLSGMKHKYYVCGKTASQVSGLTTTNGQPLPSPPHCIYVCAERTHPALYFDDLALDELHWIDESEPLSLPPANAPPSSLNLRVKIRSGPSSTNATLLRDADARYRVTFTEPQFSIAPGQTCVFYDASGQRCLGEGHIQRAGPSFAQQRKPVPAAEDADS